MELNQETLAELVATKLVSESNFRHRVAERTDAIIEDSVRKQLAETADRLLQEAAERAFANWKDIKLHRTNQWGEPKGEAVSLPQWCEEQILAKSQIQYGGKSHLAQEACTVVRELVTKEISDLLSKHRAALNELVNQTLAAEIAKKVSR